MAKIVLASGSPRRRELLTRMGIADFDVRVPETEETYPPNLSPRETVEYISRGLPSRAPSRNTMVSAVMTISSGRHKAAAARAFSREMYSTVSRGLRLGG